MAEASCRLRRTAPVVAALLALAAAGVSAAALEGTRETMHSIFDSVRTLLRVSVEPGGFEAVRDPQRVLGALTEIEDQAAILAEHAGRDDPGTDFLATSLERYAFLLRRNYEWGRHGHTERLLHRLTEVCIACHTRLVSPGDSPVAEQFLSSETLSSLAPADRARLEVATRRFDDGLARYASLLRAGTLDPEAAEEALRTHLTVSVRVRRDFARPAELLDELVTARVLPQPLHERAVAWRARLWALAASPPHMGSLAEARALARCGEGRARMRRDGFVDFLTATAILERWLEARADTPPSRQAQAYWLLGCAEDGIGREDGLPQAELWLESAILADPSSPFAVQAYELLESRVRETFTDASGGIPPEIRQHLDRLAAKIRNAS